jgi:peroxiredoxin Q/BCP
VPNDAIAPGNAGFADAADPAWWKSTLPRGLETSVSASTRRARSSPDTIGPVIERGQPAPDFELPDQDGRATKLSDFRGQHVIVYFYPKADTPGCTTQACGVRDRKADYADADAVVLGISPDPVAKVKKFHDKQSLNFTLLADQEHSVADAYGVWVEKSMYGRNYFGNERTTFVIDPDGKVAEVLRKVKPAEHDDRALAALAPRS